MILLNSYYTGIGDENMVETMDKIVGVLYKIIRVALCVILLAMIGILMAHINEVCASGRTSSYTGTETSLQICLRSNSGFLLFCNNF